MDRQTDRQRPSLATKTKRTRHRVYFGRDGFSDINRNKDLAENLVAAAAGGDDVGGGGDGATTAAAPVNIATEEGKEKNGAELTAAAAAAAAAAPPNADGEKLPSIPKESLVSDSSIKSLRKKRVSMKEEPFQVWDKTGSLLGPGYLKGLTSRIVGNSQNLAEHKLLEVNLNIMRKQRAQVMHSWDARLKREQQILINNKAEWEMRRMRGRKKTAKAKLAIAKAKEALQEAMSRPINRAFNHRFTKDAVETVAELAKGRSFMASNIRQSLHVFKDILAKVGIYGEAERKNAELLLQMRDHLEGLSAFEPEFLKRLQQTLPPDSPPTAFDILVDQIKVNRREELLQEYEKAFVARMKQAANAAINNNQNHPGNANRNNVTDAMKEAMAQVKREAVTAQLYNQSLLLQSHPFVTAAILLGKEIPYGYGGLGNKGEKKKDDIGEIKVKKKAKEDSMDMFGLDDDDSGMCAVRDVFVAMNMVETKDVNDRISNWLEMMEAQRQAAEEVERNRKAAARRDAALAMLAGGTG